AIARKPLQSNRIWAGRRFLPYLSRECGGCRNCIQTNSGDSTPSPPASDLPPYPSICHSRPNPMRPFRIVFVLVLLLPGIALAQTRPVEWDSLARESQTVLADYLRVNTTNPPGNELLAARFLK